MEPGVGPTSCFSTENSGQMTNDSHELTPACLSQALDSGDGPVRGQPLEANQRSTAMPEQTILSRREFGKLTVAVAAGLCAGAELAPASGNRRDVPNPILSDPHICRGLNTCRGKGADRRNNCAGTGACATARAHPCKGHNDCRGQGGCDAQPGENQCRGWGMCDVPLKPMLWTKARGRFEQLMKQANRRFGAPPYSGYGWQAQPNYVQGR